MKKIDNRWFFRDLPQWCKPTLIFIRGDIIFLLPLITALIITAFFSLRFGLLMTGVYVSVRFLGEMIYWLLQQFGDKKYRPHDWGLCDLDNNAIYILYQTFAMTMTVIGIGVVMYALLYLY